MGKLNEVTSQVSCSTTQVIYTGGQDSIKLNTTQRRGQDSIKRSDTGGQESSSATFDVVQTHQAQHLTWSRLNQAQLLSTTQVVKTLAKSETPYQTLVLYNDPPSGTYEVPSKVRHPLKRDLARPVDLW